MEILKFNDLYNFTQIEFMHSYLHNKLPTSFEGIWSKNRENKLVMLRNSGEIFIPRARLFFSERLPLHSIPKIFNEFPDNNIKNIPSKNSFKDQLKLFYLNELNSEVFCGRSYCWDCFSDN